MRIPSNDVMNVSICTCMLAMLDMNYVHVIVQEYYPPLLYVYTVN